MTDEQQEPFTKVEGLQETNMEKLKNLNENVPIIAGNEKETQAKLVEDLIVSDNEPIDIVDIPLSELASDPKPVVEKREGMSIAGVGRSVGNKRRTSRVPDYSSTKKKKDVYRIHEDEPFNHIGQGSNLNDVQKVRGKKNDE